MNYRDFFKNHKATAEDIRKLMPEGVDPDEFQSGIKHEKEHTDDEFTAAKIAGDHLNQKKGGDPKYYSKLDAAGLEEDDQNEHCGACKDDMGDEEGYPHDDFNDGLPKLGGALSIPHLGDPIRMSKIIQVGGEFKDGKPASGEQSGMTSCGSGKGVTKDSGGVKADAPGDKEPITAGGKKPDSSLASKTVGGPVSSGEGQKQGGPNSQGTIASTPKLNEHKEMIRNKVKQALKEIRFDKESGKWIRIDEGKHKSGCKCGFCKNKGTFGKKKDKDKGEKEEKVDETVDMKMGPSYKKVQPRMYKVADDDFARTNQYDPEISEMIDEEEIQKMHERYAALITAPKNLSESELAEMKTLREKISRNFGASNGGVEPNIYHEGRCEDYPCCGHEAGDCPDSEGRFTCVGCGKRLPRNAGSSICPRCQSRMGDLDRDDPTGQDSESMFGGDYQNETVNMKMGPSHKTVQPRLYKTSDDDFARTNQYDPQVSEVTHHAEENPPTHQGHKGQSGFRLWNCQRCGHELSISSTERKPDPIRWTDGHVCNFVPADAGKGVGAEPMGIGEAGGMSVQHRSYRTIDDAPQNPKAREDDEVCEGEKKSSKVVRTIKKGQKSKKNLPTKLKHEVPRHTTSGVHKRKT